MDTFANSNNNTDSKRNSDANNNNSNANNMNSEANRNGNPNGNPEGNLSGNPEGNTEGNTEGNPEGKSKSKRNRRRPTQRKPAESSEQPRKPARNRRKVSQRRQQIDELNSKFKVFAIDPEILRILFTPSDPDFAFPIPVVELDLHLPLHYPNQGPPPYISVKNDDIPRGNAINLERAFLEYTGSLAERVSKLDTNLESLLSLPAAKTFTIVKGKRPASAITGTKPNTNTDVNKAIDTNDTTNDGPETQLKNLELEPKPEDCLDASSESEAGDSDSSSDSSLDYEPEYMHSSDDEDVDSGNTNGRDLSKPKREGTEIILHDVRLTNIALCEIVSLNILFQCGRCKNLHTFANLQSAEYGKQTKPRAEICSKCDLPLLAAFRKEYLHSMSHTAGYLDVDGGKVADLLPSSFVAMCGQCQTTSPVFKNVDMGAQRMMNCRNCHAKMWIQLELFEFVLLSTETLAPDAKKIERAKLPSQAPKQKLHLTGGEPLPNHGTCEHYRKSTRWFRFSCCQRVFPCDRCHDAEMQHPSDLATRMICGYCSREQRFTSKCIYCEHDYTQRVTRFWEGGKGVRDRKLMSRKDKRKYKRDPEEKKKSESHFRGKSKEPPK